MGAWDVVWDVVTVGGHSRLRRAVAEYQQEYRAYQEQQQQTIQAEAEARQALADLGLAVTDALKTLERARSLLAPAGLAVVPPANLSISNRASTPVPAASGYASACDLLDRYHSAAAAAGGLITGGAAAIGAWSLVSLVGTASTGTAISTLSGAAAFNATLAWFGGGALAAGGAGMAGGAVALGGIVLISMVVVAVWSTHKQAAEAEAETERVQRAAAELTTRHQALKGAYWMARDQVWQVRCKTTRLEEAPADTRKTLFPYWGLSAAWRRLRSWLGGHYYEPSEQEAVARLDHAVRSFTAAFSRRSG